jgi:chondroitin AC lyase
MKIQIMIMRRFFPTIFCSISLGFIMIGSSNAQQVDSSNVVMISDRLRSLLYSTSPDKDSILKWIRTMQPDGSWKGIDYFSTSFTAWPAIQHLNYVSGFANAYGNKQSSLYKDKRVEKALKMSLDFWLRHNLVNQNWWWDDIGVPETLSNIFILMDGNFTHDELLRAFNQMRGSYIQQTGQNRIWRAGIQLKIGLLGYRRNVETNLIGSPEERIKNGIKILQKQVTVGEEEGIQPDWSFHQHGIQQQFGNYGLSFAASQVQWAWVLKNSPFQYSHKEIGILRNYILKGLSMVVWKGGMDISACGRQLYPASPETKGREVVRILKLMSEVDQEDSSAYSSCIDYISGEKSSGSLTAKNIYFWKSDLMIQRSPDYYMSVRTHSRIIQSTESGAGDNLLGSYLADGATYVFQTGKEYYDIFPIWNWRRIPGVTSYVQEPLPPSGWVGLPNESNFVGGISDSSFGLASMLFKRDGLTAYKSWFASPEGMVCLGAGIHSNKNTNVSTTLNQSLFDKKIIVETDKRRKNITTPGEAISDKNIRWIYHAHTGYIILERDFIRVSDNIQTGTWKSVYTPGNPDPVTGEVFNLWIDHGEAPDNKSYAYMILPSVTMKSLTSISRHLPLEILQNDTLLQAIQYPNEKITQAVFYHPGKINLNKETILYASRSCLVMTEQLGRAIKLIVSVPPEGEGVRLDANGFPLEKANSPGTGNYDEDIILFLNGHYNGDGCKYDSLNNKTAITFKLPTGIYAGKGISRIVTIAN